MISEDKGVSEEEANRVAREIAEELGLVAGPRSKVCSTCGRIVKNKDWNTHQEDHRIHDLRRRGSVEW